MRRIDLNCDLGEGAGNDAALMPLISSANIACGAHAGDEATMRETCRFARAHGVAIGAHPGFPDRENFGRVERAVAPAEAAALIETQVGVLAKIAGDGLGHVKLHGALYNQVSRDAALAATVTDALQRRWPDLALYALAGSELFRAARGRGLRVASEVFADRTYQRDGSLMPRSRPGAVIEDEEVAVAQALRLARDGAVRAADGTEVAVAADTICLHGDGVHAVALARRIHAELKRAGIEVRAFGV
jgi:5-oxoprolinase (ATP-hydrolysing) subunit A